MFSSARQKWTSPDGQHICKANLSEESDKRGTTDTNRQREETEKVPVIRPQSLISAVLWSIGQYFTRFVLWSHDSVIFNSRVNKGNSSYQKY